MRGTPELGKIGFRVIENVGQAKKAAANRKLSTNGKQLSANGGVFVENADEHYDDKERHCERTALHERDEKAPETDSWTLRDTVNINRNSRNRKRIKNGRRLFQLIGADKRNKKCNSER